MKLIVGILGAGKYSPAFCSLPPSITYMKDDGELQVLVHHSPAVTYTSGKIESNFHILIDIGIAKNEELAHILGNRYFPLVRESKSLQAYKLVKTVQELGLMDCLEIPDSSYAVLFDNTQFSQIPCIVTQKNSGSIIIKSNYGAKGLYQVLVPVHGAYEFMIEAGRLSAGDIRKRYPNVKFKDNGDPDATVFFTGDQNLFQEFIPDIIEEYRLLYTNGRIWSCIQRTLTTDENGYQQANRPKDSANAMVCNEARISTDVLKALTEVLSSIGFEFGSVDLYRRKDGRYGIFEYSNEFGSSSYSNHFLREFHTAYISSVVTRYLDSL